jgi:hypothetical protein
MDDYVGEEGVESPHILGVFKLIAENPERAAGVLAALLDDDTAAAHARLNQALYTVPVLDVSWREPLFSTHMLRLLASIGAQAVKAALLEAGYQDLADDPVYDELAAAVVAAGAWTEDDDGYEQLAAEYAKHE